MDTARKVKACMRETESGEKLTDEVILELLQLLALHTGVQYIPPSVLMAAHLPGTCVSTLTHVPRAMLIVHMGLIEAEGHWLLVTYEKHNRPLCVYNSTNVTVHGPQLINICHMVFCDLNIQKVTVATPQRNNYECGVLSAANAVEWALGGDPAHANYEYSALRPHLSYLLRE